MGILIEVILGTIATPLNQLVENTGAVGSSKPDIVDYSTIIKTIMVTVIVPTVHVYYLFSKE